jgi:hypothetical protein
LYTKIPTFEELEADRKILYHNDKELYNKWARKGGNGLYFARSGIHGETWVPLIEKAYAKLHGCYLALDDGETCEAIEDMTGYDSNLITSLTATPLRIILQWCIELHPKSGRFFPYV